jgi:hypothetical protein
LEKELAASQARVKLLRGALAGLVGVGDEKGLEQMEFVIRNHSAPDADKTDMLNAIHALQTTLAEPLYRCADRDDGCGHCERSEPHTHPDEQPGDDCDRRKGKVTCERV